MVDNLKGTVTRYMVCTATIGSPPSLKTLYIDIKTIIAFAVDAGGVVTIYTQELDNVSVAGGGGLLVNETLYELMDSIVQKLPT